MAVTEIIKRNGEVIKLNTKEPFCAVKQATQNSSLMGDDYITLQIYSSQWLSFEKGDKIVVDGFDYTIRTTTTREIPGDEYYIFEPIFYGPMYDLIKTLYRNCDKDGKSDRSTFDLTYTIKEFVKVIIYNLNRDYPGLWAFDELNCPETEAITIQFSGVNCLQVLQTLCSKDNFNLEFLITQNAGVRTIHIGKFGQRVNPPSGADYFEWGKGNGLYKLKEQKVDDKAIITRLWVEGGTTNIRTDYRNYSERLQLPYPKRMNQFQHTLYDGTVVEPNTMLIGIANDSERFLEDVALRNKIGSEEDCKNYDNIFPTRTGKVTALVDGDIYAFIDDTMDFDLCAKDDKGTIYLVNEVSAKINFTSGRLAGQQFELEAKGGYDHASKKFRLIPFTDKRGLTTPTEPNGAFPIEIGDTYKITDIFLPESYEKRAEEDLWFAGYNDFKPATQAKAQYSLTLDRLYFLDALSRDSEVCLFKVGDYVPVRDTRYGIEKQIRIQKITRNLLLEQDYQLTLSDTTAISIQTQTVLSVIEHEQIINNNRLRDLNKARRGWRTTEDLRNMVYDTDGYFDTGNIRPNSIDTNMLTVGSKSQQFVLSGVILQANVDGNPNRFSASAGILSHLTIDPNGIRAWQMNSQTFTVPSTAGYYLFAKCSKSGTSGTWLLTQNQYKFEPTDDPNNYYFLVGVLSTLYSDDNFRDFSTTYGFTRINGNTITTGRIITSDGECYLDLDGNKFRIGDASSSIDWNVSRAKGITLKNVSVVSESGDVSPLGVFRGTWDASYIYYPNDEVSYTDYDGDGATCTYRYIHPQPSKGHFPTEGLYWSIVAKGANGTDGKNADSNRLVFRYSIDKPERPTGTALTPVGWSDTPDREDVVATHGTVFTLKDGYYVSPTIDHNGITKNRITLVTTKPNQIVAIEIWAQSETNFDFVLVGKLDTEGLTRTTNYLDRVSGPDAKKIVYVDIPTAGTHFVDVAYAKDQSNSLNGDCGRYRIVAVYNCWLSVGTVAGGDEKVIAWSDPIPFSIDTPDVERIYRLMATETTPDTPQSDEFTDDYVPPLTTEKHVVGKLYQKGDVVIGANGSYYECIVATTTSTPVTQSSLVGSRPIWIMNMDWAKREGWTDNPTGVTTSYRFEYESVRQKKNGKWGPFSTPVLWMVLPLNGSKGDKGDKGDDGENGKNGDYTEYRYVVSGSKTAHNAAFDATKRDPGSSWKTTMPSVGALQYLWLTTAKINGETNALRENWTTPIRVTPYDGEDGKPGAKGDSPALVFRGVYDSNATYYGNKLRVDAVKFNNHFYVRAIDNSATKGVLPTNTSKWNDFGAEFETIATGFLLAENANIANLIFRNERLESQTLNADGIPNIFIDGSKGIAWYSGSIINPFKRITKTNVTQYITKKTDEAGEYAFLDLEKCGLKIMFDLTTTEFYNALGDSGILSCMLPSELKYVGAELEIFNGSSTRFSMTGAFINTLWEDYTPPGFTESPVLLANTYYRYRCMPLSKSKYYSQWGNHYSLKGDFYIVWILIDMKTL